VGEVFSKGDWGMPLVHSAADYRRPWRLGEQVRIEGRILEMTDRRVAFEYGFFDQEGTRRTRVEMHHAFVSLESFKARSIPPGFREAMTALGLVGEG
jgi:acyl-CoA thioesterase FadM